ncbi:MAG: hypothetical protein ACLTXL_07110 [Clostridia bacterium]
MEKGEKRVREEGWPKKCPPVREPQRSGVEKGRKGVRGGGWPKKMPAGEGSQERAA